MSAARTDEERITELEVKLGFAEDLLDELNKTVFRQQQQLEQLQLELKALRQQVQLQAPAEPRSLADELPPHY